MSHFAPYLKGEKTAADLKDDALNAMLVGAELKLKAATKTADKPAVDDTKKQEEK
jgi:hypothetical protein